MCYYIDVDNPNRENFINYLEQLGLILDEGFCKKDMIEHCLPIIVDFETKRIKMLNVTCACVALRHGVIKKEEEFLKMIDGKYSMKDSRLLII